MAVFHMNHDLCVFLSEQLRQQGLRLVTAESCTGGLIAATCTDMAGSSDWFERGFVTYSNAAKTECLDVPQALLAAHGAVSAEVAQAMALGALRHSEAQLAVAVTGIAGPGHPTNPWARCGLALHCNARAKPRPTCPAKDSGLPVTAPPCEAPPSNTLWRGCWFCQKSLLK